MPWFNLDDQFHHHDKVIAAGRSAIGLWTMVASWSMATLTDGFVSDKILRSFAGMEDGVQADADALVRAGMWTRDDGRAGFMFVNWERYQRSSELIKQNRERQGKAMGVGRASCTPAPARHAHASDARDAHDQARQSNPLKGVGLVTNGTKATRAAPADAAGAGAANPNEKQKHSDPVIDEWMAADEKAHCQLCDDDGYRGSIICDHIDRTQTHAAGLAAVQESLNEAKAKKANRK